VSVSSPSWRREAWLFSLGAHAALIAVFSAAVWLGRSREPETVEFMVIENPVEAPTQAKPTPMPPRAPELMKAPPKPEVRASARKVFGVAKNAVMSDTGLETKAGNTVAKAQDDIKLRASDEDALPIPADEFLVSRMPRLKSEVRVPYPEAAKKAGIEGAVIMDILVDATGRVREATLVEGPGQGLNEAALAAVRRFEFEPAQMGDKRVAVRIRYAYRFVLER